MADLCFLKSIFQKNAFFSKCSKLNWPIMECGDPYAHDFLDTLFSSSLSSDKCLV